MVVIPEMEITKIPLSALFAAAVANIVLLFHDLGNGGPLKDLFFLTEHFDNLVLV